MVHVLWASFLKYGFLERFRIIFYDDNFNDKGIEILRKSSLAQAWWLWLVFQHAKGLWLNVGDLT